MTASAIPNWGAFTPAYDPVPVNTTPLVMPSNAMFNPMAPVQMNSQFGLVNAQTPSFGSNWGHSWGQGTNMSAAAPSLMQRAGNWFGQSANLGAAAQMFGALGSGIMAYKQYGLAKDSLRQQKDAFELNARNQIQSYNTSLEDRIRGRTSAYEGKDADVQAYLSKHSLRR